MLQLCATLTIIYLSYTLRPELSRGSVKPTLIGQLDNPTARPMQFVLTVVEWVPLQETRQALGVRLEGAVVVVDEAHNLVDAVNASHSACISNFQLALAHAQLSGYLQRFETRLAPGLVVVCGNPICNDVQAITLWRLVVHSMHPLPSRS